MKYTDHAIAVMMHVAMIVALFFLFYGDPDLFDALRDQAIAKAGVK